MISLLLALALLPRAGSDFELAIAHVNDIHAHLDPVTIRLKDKSELSVGGAPALVEAFHTLRAQNPNFLALHAGDEFSGTLHFSLHLGLADAWFLNRMGLDAFVPGNHEFDRGPRVLSRFLDSLKVPAVGANLFPTSASPLQGKIRPWIVKDIGGHRIGIVGIVTPQTPTISSPGPSLGFRQPETILRKAVDSLNAQGVRIVIVLSHCGLEVDTVLARKVPGIAAIVGGHSHTLMGKELAGLGLRPQTPYPWIRPLDSGRVVVVAQAWEWGKAIGDLHLSFDARERLVAAHGSSLFVTTDSVAGLANQLVVHPHREELDTLRSLSRPLDSLRRSVVAKASKDLPRHGVRGSGPLVCQAMLHATGGMSRPAQVAIANPGGIRTDLSQGDITVAAVHEVLPFDNTLHIFDLPAPLLVQVLLQGLNHPNGMHSAGIEGILDRKISNDSNLTHLRLRLPDGSTHSIASTDTVRLVTFSYLAGGGDGFHLLKNFAGNHFDTGIPDHLAFLEWLKEIRAVEPMHAASLTLAKTKEAP